VIKFVTDLRYVGGFLAGIPNRSVVSGIEALCILLRRLAYPNRLADITDMYSLHQAQASDQFLATNKAMCIKVKTINKSKMYF
jgi:hypothetical protein